MLLFALLFFFISLISLAIATYTDLKKRIIPDRLSYSIIALGLLLNLAYSFVEGNFSIFLIAAAVTAATFIFSYILWKFGVWAGGDVKIMTGLAALNPVNYGIIRDFLGIKAQVFASFGYGMPIFPLTLFIFSLFSMLPYGAILGISSLMKRPELRKKIFSGFGEIALYLLAAFVAIIAFSFIMKLQLLEYLMFFCAIIAFIFMLRLFFMRSILFEKTIKITELEEGMIAGEAIALKDGEVERKKGTGNIINYLINNNLAGLSEALFPKGRLLANPRSAAGFTGEQIDALKALVREKKTENAISIKSSAPFVPAVLIAYLVLQCVGDLLWNLIF